MYFGYVCVTASLGVFLLGRPMVGFMALSLVPLVWRYYDKTLIPTEELILKLSFRDEYEKYRERTGRWITYPLPPLQNVVIRDM